MKNSLFRYKGCGLDNIYLRNGYSVRKDSEGEDVIRIENIEGLHKAIAAAVVESPAPLDSKTFRFLRKEQCMSQRSIARVLGCEEQTVSLWERGTQAVPQSADLVLRTLTKETLSGHPEISNLIERVNSLDRELRGLEARIEFEKDGAAWEKAA